ncbi:hypothetical protein A0256_04545 [Mucilaginibacter sp. PAMC 26640]|nr:hypothetical protein A0256_04545 [Mucilaginibacter sp. PAMC 26640]
MNEINQLDPWLIIQNNEFEKAIKLIDLDFEKNRNPFVLQNKIFALFHLNKYEDAIILSEKLIGFQKAESENAFKSSGIANWILGNTAKAMEVWQQSQNCLYKDASGGVEIQLFLYFSGIKTGQDSLKAEAVKTVKKLLKSKRATNWPGPLGHYLINDITDIELFSYVSAIPIFKERQLCQAHFVSAIKILETGNKDEYYKKLMDCISYGPNSYLEQMYYLAKGELETSKL